MYIDEAVMEVNTEEFGANTMIVKLSFFHHIADDAGHIWACCLVETRA